jgi:hypothetical protein
VQADVRRIGGPERERDAEPGQLARRDAALLGIRAHALEEAGGAAEREEGAVRVHERYRREQCQAGPGTAARDAQQRDAHDGEQQRLHARRVPREQRDGCVQEHAEQDQMDERRAQAREQHSERAQRGAQVQRREPAGPLQREPRDLEHEALHDHVAGRHPEHVAIRVELRGEQAVRLLDRDRGPQEGALVGPGRGEAQIERGHAPEMRRQHRTQRDGVRRTPELGARATPSAVHSAALQTRDLRSPSA